MTRFTAARTQSSPPIALVTSVLAAASARAGARLRSECIQKKSTVKPTELGEQHLQHPRLHLDLARAC